MDKEQIVKYLSTLPLWAKIVVIIVITLLSVVTLCSCGVLKQVDLTDMRLGANGNVSKEKTVTKTTNTKWYAEPMPREEVNEEY